MRKGKRSTIPCCTANSKKSSGRVPASPPASAKSNMASQMEENGQDPAMLEQSNFTALMQAITDCKSTLTGKIDSLQLELALIRKDVDTVQSRITTVEHRVSDTEDMLHDHAASLHTLKAKVKCLESCTEDTENRNRRNNLRIMGLPEGG